MMTANCGVITESNYLMVQKGNRLQKNKKKKSVDEGGIRTHAQSMPAFHT